jgi:hypothetical protein
MRQRVANHVTFTSNGISGVDCFYQRQFGWISLVGSTELESVTSCVSSRRSNQLSYEPGLKQRDANPQYIMPPRVR